MERNIPGRYHKLLNSEISKAVLGHRPREFLRKHKLIEKKKNRRGNNVYPAHPNGRDVMTEDQLRVVSALEVLTKNAFATHDVEDAYNESVRRCETIGEMCTEMHNTHLAKPTNLEEVKQIARDIREQDRLLTL